MTVAAAELSVYPQCLPAALPRPSPEPHPSLPVMSIVRTRISLWSHPSPGPRPPWPWVWPASSQWQWSALHHPQLPDPESKNHYHFVKTIVYTMIFTWMRHADTKGSLCSLSVASFISTDILKPISGPLILWTVFRSPPEQKVFASFSAPLRIRPTPSVQVSSSSTTCNRVVWMRCIVISETIFQFCIIHLEEVYHHGSRHCITSLWIVEDNMGNPTLIFDKVNRATLILFD